MRPPVQLYYHGTLNEARLPPTILEAMKGASSPPTLRFAGYETAGSVGYVDGFMREASRLGIASSVRYLGPLDRATTLDEAAACDVGLALAPMRPKDPNLGSLVGASNKPFDYLAKGLALIVSDLPEWRRLYVDRGCGLACNPDDVRSLIDTFDALSRRPDTVREMGERGRSLVRSEWNYERQFEPVLEVMAA